MRYRLSGVTIPLLLLTVLSLGCPDSDDNELDGSTFDAVGTVRPGPTTPGTPPPGENANVDGVWRAFSTVTVNDCGSRVPALTEPQIVDISQSDSVLNVHVFDACGDLPIATGVGTINGPTVSLSFTQQILVSPNCTLRIHTVQSGSVVDDQNVISGTSRSTVTGLGNCGSGLPCEVKADLLMERCPPASCKLNSCR